jgi:hypothetical protein
MVLGAWLNKKPGQQTGSQRRRRGAAAEKTPARRPALEALEDRTLPSGGPLGPPPASAIEGIRTRALVGATDTLSTSTTALVTSDLVFDGADGMLYASVPHSAPTGADSLAQIDPRSGAVVDFVSVGNNPGKLAVSDDGQFVYVALNGAPSVVRFNVAAHAVDQTISLGTGAFGPRYAEDLAVAPGAPTTLAVSLKRLGISPRHDGVAIFVDGAQLPVVTPDHTGSNSIAFGATGGRLYGYNNETTEFGFRRMNVGPTGVTTQDVTGVFSGFGVTIKYDPGTGLVYSSNGTVLDPEPAGGAPQLVGMYPNTGFASAVLPDSGTGRTYFISGGQLRVYDQGRFNAVESFALPADGGSLLRWGDNQFAYRSGTNVYFVTLTPDAFSLGTNDLVYDPYDGLLYASVPGSAGLAGNSLAQINPVTGRVQASFYLGSEPGKLAVSDDGRAIYAGLNGAAAVARFNVAAQAVDLRFSLGTGSFGPRFAEDIQVAPGDASTVAVALRFNGVSPRQAGVGMFVDGVELPTATGGSNSIAFGATGGRLYGYNNETTEFGFRRMNVGPDGVSTQDATGGLVGAFNVTIKYDAGTGLVYTTNGRIINPEPDSGPPVSAGAYAGVGFASSVLPDSASGRTFFISGGRLLAYDQTGLGQLGNFALPADGGSLVSIGWWDNHLAYRSGTQVYFVELVIS